MAVGVIVAGLAPFGLAGVQEDAFMEIDMLFTQTENPFRIQDWTDTDVFSIDTEGTIHGENGWFDLEYIQPSGTIISITDTFNPDEFVLAQWNLTRADAVLSGDHFLVTRDSAIYGEFQYGAVFNNCKVDVESFQDGTWAIYGMDLIGNSATWESQGDFGSEFIAPNVESIRIILHMTQLGTCEFRNIVLAFAVVDVDSYTWERVV